MKRLLTILTLSLLITISVRAQNTSVSATVTDAGSVVWANGTYTFTFVPNTQYTNGPFFNNGVPYTPTTLSGSLNGSGAFTQSVPSNSTITPSGSFWIVTYCPQATAAACQNSGKLTITGGSQNISASFIPAALVVQPGANQTVYNTNEVGTSIVGSQIYLIGTGLETCSAVTGTVCNTWVSGGGGSGVSSLNTLTGAVTLAAGSGVTLTPSGNTITIASTGGGGTTTTIASGTAALGTSSIASDACAAVVTVVASGVATTDNIMADFNNNPTGSVGYEPGSMLTIIKYPTSGNVNFIVCNNTINPITPAAQTINWRVVR